MRIRADDFIVFGKIISVAFLIGGFIFLGYLTGGYCVEKGCPEWSGIAGMTAGAVIGLHQAWMVIRSIIQDMKRDKRQ
jgi:hypothetical protein